MTIVFTVICFVFFFNDTATTEIYTLSLHDALPISHRPPSPRTWRGGQGVRLRCLLFRGEQEREHDQDHQRHERRVEPDRKSTRLNSSHSSISYAVFCLKKKKKKNSIDPTVHKLTYL